MRTCLGLFLIIAAMPFAASAQETGTGSTATGSTVVATDSGSVLRRLDLLAAEATARGIKSRGDLQTREGKFAQIAEERTRHEARSSTYRAECRERLRKANRDEKATVSADCFSDLLALELSLLRKERQMLSSFAFLAQDLRDPGLRRTDALIDAVQAVIDGIDAEIYTEIADLEDAKARLHAKYRLPRAAALLAAEADMERGWNALIALHLRDRIRNDSSLLEPLGPLADAVACLEVQQSAWAGFPGTFTYLEIKSKMSQFQSEQSRCLHFIRSVNDPTGSAAPVEPQQAE